MKTLKDIKRHIESVGGEFHDIGSDRFVGAEIWTPAGKVWNASMCHVCTCQAYKGKGASAFVVESLSKDIAAGMVDCDDAECDHCHSDEVIA